MKEIPLTRGMVALVDDEDFSRVNIFRWHIVEGKASFYAGRKITLNPKPRGSKVKGVKRKRKYIMMHSVIMGTGEDELVHHNDSNGLNNQKSNLKRTDYYGNNRYAAEKRKENGN